MVKCASECAAIIQTSLDRSFAEQMRLLPDNQQEGVMLTQEEYDRDLQDHCDEVSMRLFRISRRLGGPGLLAVPDGERQKFVQELGVRANAHDASKRVEPEASVMREWIPVRRSCEFGSAAYNDAMGAMEPALQHHYEANRHHPEHFAGGVAKMGQLDLLEMLADWKAASLRQPGRPFATAFATSCERFHVAASLRSTLDETVTALGWW